MGAGQKRFLWLGLFVFAGCDGIIGGATDGAGVTPRGAGGAGVGEATTGTGRRASSLCADTGPQVGPSRMRLLTRYEFDNTVRRLLGDETRPAASLPSENRSTAFENNAADHRASAELVRGYGEIAEDIAERAVAQRRASLLPCNPAEDGQTRCGHAFIANFLQRAFRRPATPEEQTAFQQFFDERIGQSGFNDAMTAVIEATLQSPQFLYRLEMVPEGSGSGDMVEVTGYEMASRLSYFLTASMPDEPLLEAAANGRLSTAEDIEIQARRLLDGALGRRAVAEFHRQWLELDGLNAISKDPTLFPELDTARAGPQLRASVEAFVEHAFFEVGTLDALFQSNLAFLSPELASVYGLGAADPATGAYTLESARGGLLTQPGLMAMLAQPDMSSPIQRGVFVRKKFLCQDIPPPPAATDISSAPFAPDATTREFVTDLTSDAACSGCHNVINPVGFGFEHFDAIGRFRAEEKGKPIDASGTLNDLDDKSAEGDYVGARQLATMIARSSDFQDCFVEQWATFALGRLPAEADQCSVERAAIALEESGGDLREMLVAIATSPAFMYRVVEN